MRNKIIIAGIVACLTAAPAFAATASKQEKIGVGVGATIGAVAGGPIGLMVGAAIGAKIGDDYHQQDETVDHLSTSLNRSNGQVAQLEGDIRALDGEIAGLDSEVARLKATGSPELVALLQAGIAMDLLFRTDEDVLANATGGKLQQLATTLAAMQDIQIRLDGFADERGDATYNQQLSVRRADHVRDVLLANGIPAARIQVNAHGESPALDTNVDSYALERKVSLTLYVEENPSFASNPL
jgi:outer membrane protein OmpA-like peptidoglycan-associated protein